MPLSDEEFDALITGAPKPVGNALSDSEFDSLLTGTPAPVQQSQPAQPTTAQKIAKTLSAADPYYPHLPGMPSLMDSAGFLTGVAETLGGIQQMNTDVLESLGLLPKGASDKMMAFSSDDIEQINNALVAEMGGSAPMFKIANFAGKMAPGFIFPGGPAGTTAGAALTRVLTSAGIGAMFGGSELMDKPIDERVQERKSGAATGAVLGAALGGIIEAPTQIKQAFARAVKKTQTSEYAKEGLRLDEKLRQFSGGEDIGLKLSQVTGDPFAEALEGAARGGTSVERIAREYETKQQSVVWGYFKKLADDILDTSKSLGSRVQDAFDQTTTKLIESRRAQAKVDFDAASDAASAAAAATRAALRQKAGIPAPYPPVSSEPELPVLYFKNAVREEIDKIGERPSGQLIALRAGLVDLYNKYAAAAGDYATTVLKDGAYTPVSRAGRDTMKIKEIGNELVNWSGQSRGSGAIFKDYLDGDNSRRIATKLWRALEDDLTAAIESGTPGAELLRVARDNYRANTEPLTALRETALGRFLGESGVPKTPMELEHALTTMQPDQLMNGLKLIQKADPQLHAGLQRFWLERTFSKMNEERQLAEFGNVNTRKMLEILDPNGKFNAIFTDPAMREQIIDGLKIVGRIQRNSYQQGRRLAPYLKEAAGIAMSRNPTFTARFAAELFTPKILSRVLTTKEGTVALRELEKPYNANRWAAAVGTLSNIMYPSGPPEE